MFLCYSGALRFKILNIPISVQGLDVHDPLVVSLPPAAGCHSSDPGLPLPEDAAGGQGCGGAVRPGREIDRACGRPARKIQDAGDVGCRVREKHSFQRILTDNYIFCSDPILDIPRRAKKKKYPGPEDNKPPKIETGNQRRR